MQYCIVKYIWKSIKMYLFYGINEDNMWPNAEGRLIHFTNGVSSHQCHLYDTPCQNKKKKKKKKTKKRMFKYK